MKTQESITAAEIDVDRVRELGRKRLWRPPSCSAPRTPTSTLGRAVSGIPTDAGSCHQPGHVGEVGIGGMGHGPGRPLVLHSDEPSTGCARSGRTPRVGGRVPHGVGAGRRPGAARPAGCGRPVHDATSARVVRRSRGCRPVSGRAGGRGGWCRSRRTGSRRSRATSATGSGSGWARSMC